MIRESTKNILRLITGKQKEILYAFVYFSTKWYGFKWTWDTTLHLTKTQIKVKEQLAVRKDMDVNEHEIHVLPIITLRHKLK